MSARPSSMALLWLVSAAALAALIRGLCRGNPFPHESSGPLSPAAKQRLKDILEGKP